MAILERAYPIRKLYEAEIQRPLNADHIGSGMAESSIFRITMKMRSRANKEVSFTAAEKVFWNKRNANEARARLLLERHRRLKTLQIPTLPFMMLGASQVGKWSLAMPDLTNGGARYCISSTDPVCPQSPYYHCGRIIELSNGNEVGDHLALIAQVAQSNGVVCTSADACFLIIDKATRKGFALIGDLGNVYFEDDFDDMNIYQEKLKKTTFFIDHFAYLLNHEVLTPGCEISR